MIAILFLLMGLANCAVPYTKTITVVVTSTVFVPESIPTMESIPADDFLPEDFVSEEFLLLPSEEPCYE